MYTSFCKVITADNWKKNQPVPSVSTNFQIFIGHYIHWTYSQFLIYLHHYLEREPDRAFHFFHLYISYIPEDSDHYGLGRKLVAHINMTVTMLNMHHCLLRFHVYMSLDGAVLRCKMWICPTVIRQHQKILFGLLCTRCPCFLSFCYCCGAEVEGEMAQVFGSRENQEIIKEFLLIFNPSNLSCEPQGTWSHRQCEL